MVRELPRERRKSIQTKKNGTSNQKDESTESCHQLLRKERYLSREGFDKREKEGVRALKNNILSYLLQSSLQGRLEKLEEKMSAGKIASAEQVRGGCSDLWILLSQFSESLCYKGKWLLLGCLFHTGWVELGTEPGPVSVSESEALEPCRCFYLLCHIMFISQTGIENQSM